MFNPNSKKFPLLDFPTHSIFSSVFFIPEDKFVHNKQNVFSNTTPILQTGDNVLVYEYGIGHQGKWAKIKTSNNLIGYVMFNGSLKPLGSFPPFYTVNGEQKYQPDTFSPQINWKNEKPNIAYDDLYNGAFVVHVELENVLKIDGAEQLFGFMAQAREIGTRIILDHVGYKYSEENLQELLNKYYLFSTAEDWYLDPRPCSTLRVAVAIPKRYLYSNSQSELLKSTIGAKQPNTPIPNEYTTVSFENYDKFKAFFDSLLNTLEKFSCHSLTKTISVVPKTVPINLNSEISNLKKLFTSTNQLIAANQPQQILDISAIFPIWKNSLDIVIDKNSLSIKDIKLHSGNEKFSLNSGFTAYLRSDEVTNKTNVSYILNHGIKTGSIKDPITGALLNASPALNDIVNNLTKTASSLIGNLEQEMSSFLKDYHFPSISGISLTPMSDCFVSVETRIKDLESIKSSVEIARWKAKNADYEKDKFKIEGDIFVRSLMERDFIQDKNLRILFGVDTLPGKTPIQKLDNYLRVAKSIDWAKYLGSAAQCLTQAVPLDTAINLLDTYKEAAKFIEEIQAGNICNPYLKNGLKIFDGFELPVIKAYNPNEILARELETAFAKIINDLISFGIKKALEAAAKACAANPNASFDGSGGSNFKNPFDVGDNVNSPAVGSLLDDLYPNLKNESGNISAQNREKAKESLKNILADINTCLSLREMCSLYSGTTVNDEVYQIISSLVKRKYGSPLSDAFVTRQQISHFFKTLGANLDLSECKKILNPESPNGSGRNILCDDGGVDNLRKQILADRLTPDLIDEALNSLKQDEAKALEDILKLLNSDSPFDFSKVPDLGCKIFPSGESVAPSAQSFSSMFNSLLRSTYDVFDREATEWHKTTYSTISPSKHNFLKFNKDSGELEVIEDIKIDPNQTAAIKANSGKSSPAEQESNSSLSTGAEEIKLPSYMFKKAAKTNSVSRVNENDTTYMLYSCSLNGDDQQKLDIDFIEPSLLKTEIQKGESLLVDFAKSAFTKLSTFISIKAGLTGLDKKIVGPFFFALNSYLNNNLEDAKELRDTYNNVRAALEIGDIQDSNGFFAAENGAAIYLAICEQLRTNQELKTQLGIIGIPVPEPTGPLLKQYTVIKSYYRTILKFKINYPDFDISYKTGLNKVSIADSILPTYFQNNFYDIQKIEIQKNKKNYIKITEINKASKEVENYITGTLGLSDPSGYTKETLFAYYLKKKIAKYGSSGGAFSDTQESFNLTFEDINAKIKQNMVNKVLSRSNKFIHLKDMLGTYISSIAESGSGQPYTQYLKLVVPQTPEQKTCGIRPHYLDIDSIKDEVLEDKSNNACLEKVTDKRVVGNNPIDTNELKDIETSSTQDIMLKGMYRLAVRVFLHDILLRSIALFGYYDPQSLRDEPAFITFMSKMSESEIRATDNTFFIMLSNFLLKTYKSANPDENIRNEESKKTKLFRDLVELELKNYVLPKLAKRINADTNFALVNNTPKDNPIKLINLYDDVISMGVIYSENNAVYIKVNLYVEIPTLSGTLSGTLRIPSTEINQKIYEGSILQFLQDPEFDFLFRYLFPVSQTLNNLFILNCLSTSTKKLATNSFRGTKNDIIATCKVIQSNGQAVAKNPNDAQSISSDPMEIIMGFLLQALFKTPINILKGVAESSEPNIAITSTGFKLARAFVPKLSSFIIPAVSLPLGTIPTPITCPLPFANPLLSLAYFATMAWYDDKPTDEAVNNAASNLEKSIFKEDIKCKEDTINQDAYYLDRKTQITAGEYNINLDKIEQTADELTAEETKSRLIESEVDKTRTKILDLMKSTPYTYPDPNNSSQMISVPMGSLVSDIKLRNIIKISVKNAELAIGGDFRLIPSTTEKYNRAYSDAVQRTITDIKFSLFADASSATQEMQETEEVERENTRITNDDESDRNRPSRRSDS